MGPLCIMEHELHETHVWTPGLFEARPRLGLVLLPFGSFNGFEGNVGNLLPTLEQCGLAMRLEAFKFHEARLTFL